MYARTVRPLTDKEKRRLRRLLARRSRLSLTSPRLWVVCIGLYGVFWAAAVAVAREVLLPTVLVLPVAVLTGLSIAWSEGRRSRSWRHAIESALATDRAEEVRVVAAEAVALDESEDLGEGWAFQVEPDRILFAGPRQDWPRGFPSADFSYSEIRDASGNVVDIGFELRGTKLAPVRRIAAEAQREFDFLLDFEVLEGRLDGLEGILRVARSRRGTPGSA